MYNWNTDTTRLKKDTQRYDKYVLEQQINFGLNNTKISIKKLKANWNKLDIDQNKRNYLEKVVWTQS